MLELSDAQKLMLVASCAGLVAATILVTVCVVTPHCWLYHCIWGKDDEKGERVAPSKNLLAPFPLKRRH
ncbi:hypothetical protein IscW_ISCW008257 [Ixodes scapularis]|uniref:Uncharacterized protein n=1 Tax=Ixodes scapularis TaxID=6945 RepID=B7PS09_IXOSC|nr:hypothetical protein IscW_ISCW008257 [Ixodes scapularis]|eukprot:XP_002401605.1 hypothetical protein IscW_ISCW008257 [Ixodes scapularis]